MTLDDIEAEFSISRRTAERRRAAVDAAFGPLEPVDRDDGKRHWRLRSDALRRLVSVSAEELAELGAAAAALDRAGLGERAAIRCAPNRRRGWSPTSKCSFRPRT